MSPLNGISNSKSTESKPELDHPPGNISTSRDSLFARLLRVLVPCISSGAHAVEMDSASLSGSREKSTIKTDDHPTTVPPAPQTPQKDPTPPPSLDVADVTPLPEISVTSPQAPQNHLLIPSTPPPSQLLPLSETEGVTSGAVQPPGSTGDSPVQLETSQNRDSTVPSNGTGEGEESEGTSFTEDEDMDGLDDLEDDEEKLIMDGGAGIPIGPVSSSFIFSPYMNSVEKVTVPSNRMATQNRYYL